MQRLFARTLAGVLLASIALPALAERDIVFAARYYAKPGVRQTTHFHLYRINPDGSGRTQLTSGAHDDRAPRWSPDGQWIAFTRDQNQLCVIRASGGPLRVLSTSSYNSDLASGVFVDFDLARWLPGSHRLVLPGANFAKQSRIFDAVSGRVDPAPLSLISVRPSLDGRRIYAVSASGKEFIADTTSRAWSERVALSGSLDYPAWLSSAVVTGTVEGDGDGGDHLVAYDAASGKRLWDRNIVPPASARSDLGMAFRGTVTVPGDARYVVLAADVSSSTVRPDNDYYRVETKTGKAASWLSETQLLVFAPNGRRYVTASARTLSDYGPKRGGRQPGVWTADLSVGASSMDPKPRAIVRGLVWVIGADWRK